MLYALSLKGSIFAGLRVHLYRCSRGGLFQGIPIILRVSGLKRPWSRGLLLLSSSGPWTSALQTPNVPCDFDFPSSFVFASLLSVLL